MRFIFKLINLPKKKKNFFLLLFKLNQVTINLILINRLNRVIITVNTSVIYTNYKINKNNLIRINKNLKNLFK